MYQSDWLGRIRTWQGRSGLRDISPTVWKLGFTSLLTDISSEMVTSILPVYFVLYLHFSAQEFGFLDGISQGAAVALLSLVSGVWADRWRRQKEVATAGYALSAIGKILLLAAGRAWALAAGVLVLDRIGKGVRTAPRDAMISLASVRAQLATAFAVHRALDTCGAVLGPLMAFLMLRSLPGAFNMVLMTSFCIALIGLGVIWLLVENPVTSTAQSLDTPTFRRSLTLLAQPHFRALVIAASLLGVATISDGFIYLLLQNQTQSPAASIPLYAFLMAVVYLLLSVPAGKLADGWGRGRIFLGGYVLLGAIYGIMLSPALAGLFGNGAQYVVLVLLGAYYAMTDGVLAAMTSSTLNVELRTSGLALLNTASSIARLLSSVLFGWLWASHAIKSAVGTFLGGLIAAIAVSVWMLAGRLRVRPDTAETVTMR